MQPPGVRAVVALIHVYTCSLLHSSVQAMVEVVVDKITHMYGNTLHSKLITC